MAYINLKASLRTNSLSLHYFSVLNQAQILQKFLKKEALCGE